MKCVAMEKSDDVMGFCFMYKLSVWFAMVLFLDIFSL